MKNKGFALVSVIVAFVIISLMALFFTNIISTRGKVTVDKFNSLKSYYIAQGGLEYVLKKKSFPNYAILNQTLNDGFFSVYTSSSGIPNYIKLTSAGNYNDYKKTISMELSKNSQTPISSYNTSIAAAQNTNILTWSHTVPSGTDRLLLVGISLNNIGNPSVTTVTYGTATLTKLGDVSAGTHARVEIWYLINPAVGTANVTVTLNKTTDIVADSVSFVGVDTANPFLYTPLYNPGNFISNASAALTTNISLNITTTVNHMVLFDVLSIKDPKNITVTPGSSQQVLWSYNFQPNVYGAASVRQVTTTGTYTMSWSFNGSYRCALGATAIRLRDQTGGNFSTRILKVDEVFQ